MATFEVCQDVTVAPGGSFNWHNGNSKGVVITPQNPPWPLPNPSYSVAGVTSSSAITVSPNAVPGNSYAINVLYATSPGGPCQLIGTTPKIIIQTGKKK